MDRYLIAGGNGFIGSNLIRKLSKRGIPLFSCDLSGGFVDDIKIEQIDFLDIDCIKSYILAIKPSIIINCIGSGDVSKSINSPKHDFECNVQTINNLLISINALQMNDIRIVHISSAAVYGNPNVLPIDETNDINPISPYALDKQLSELLCFYYNDHYRFNIKIARIFSCYGEGLKKQIFWDMYLKIKKNNKIELYGNGSETRDFIHIDDVIQALLLISNTNKSNVVFNICNNEEYTIRYIASQFGSFFGLSLEAISFNGVARQGDPRKWRGNNNLIKSIGYSETININEGIQRYCNWLKANESKDSN